MKIGNTGLVYTSPVHCNGNLLCAVDVETTGKDPAIHDIIDICILPLNADYSINKSVLPFNMLIKPRRPANIDPDAMKVNNIKLSDLMLRGYDSDRTIDLLVKWFEKLNLPFNKRLTPIAQNYQFDYGFINAWLGRETYDLLFNYGARDTLSVSLFINDCYDLRNERIPYAKNNLAYLASSAKITNPAPHRALGDCVTTAALYKRFMEVVAFGGTLEGGKEIAPDLEKEVPQGVLDDNMDIFTAENTKNAVRASQEENAAIKAGLRNQLDETVTELKKALEENNGDVRTTEPGPAQPIQLASS